jgi:outer membrane receptor protein involved in Fe transport
MGKKLLALLISLSTIGAIAQTRPGSLKGTITDKNTGDAVPLADIVVYDDGGGVIASGSADFDGNFNINPVPTGSWKVVVSLLGYNNYTITGVSVQPNNPTFLTIKMAPSTEELEEVVIKYERPLIEKGRTTSTVDAETIEQMAVRDVTSIAAQTPGVKADANGGISVRGARTEATVQFIDGVKVRGNSNLPQAVIGSVEVISGGIPAQYGDAIGGIINTTTKGPSGTFFGGVEYLTSVPFDAYDYNLFAASGGGPLYKKDGRTLIGFIAGLEYQYSVEPSPQAVPYIEVDRDLLIDIEENPLVVDPSGNSVNSRTLFVTEDDLSDIQARPNSWSNQLRFNGTLQFKTSETTTLNIGGRFYYDDDKRASYVDHIFNAQSNLNNLGVEWSTFARFQQRFTNSKDAAKTSLIKNAFYTIQADFSRDFDKVYDKRFDENFFEYGYLGAFDIQEAPAYVYGQDPTTGAFGYRYVGDFEAGINFTEGGYNRVRENYTRHYFELAQDNPSLPTRTLNELLGAGVPINGRNPGSVYGIWGNAGAAQSLSAIGVGGANYWKRQNDQFRVTASTSFDIEDHSLIVGFEYEQRSDRAWALDATSLWTQMRLLQNRAVSELDLENPQFNATGDTINYNYLYSPGSRSEFAANLREKLGLNPNGTEQLNIDNMDPSTFNIDMFSAEELYNLGGNPLVKYYGYDKNGNMLSSQPTIDDFFNERDANGNRTRAVGAFQPIYIAGYVQDQFTFRDLTFNAGIRVDRFDMNQSVLKDPYVLGEFYRVSDLPNTALNSEEIPSSIGQDFVVYVSDFDYNDNTEIVGYRDGTQWYNADGDPIPNPLAIANAGGGQAKPFLVNPNDTASLLSANSFEDYTPQVVVMPRVSFTFPVTDKAIFIAHFDKLAQRPTSGVARLDPFQYLDLDNNSSGGILNNPDLRPQITTEYEIGFKQVLTEQSALKISAFYRELRDLIQVQLYAQAYPISYTAYGNQDYGTVKGFALEYDLRRTNNISIGANYTLQFANGTGSGPTSGVNLASAGQPNLRYILPLSYDTRHQFFLRFDYRYRSGRDYTGPKWGRGILENFGINLTTNASSGEPYTRRSFAYALSSGSSSVPVLGQINGARLPWQLTADLRVNKVFGFKNRKAGSLEVYIQVFNIFNTINTVNVYPFTGSPDDDGYLASEAAQSTIREQVNSQSFVDLYNRRANSPFNFSAPRRVRLGVAYNF